MTYTKAEYEADLEKWHEQVEAYAAQWPSYCRTCSGWGGFEGYEHVPPYGGYQTFEPCQDCTENGICARCGKLMQTPEEAQRTQDPVTVCPHCGFDDSVDEGIPHAPEYPWWEYDNDDQ